jgi:microcystin-dependent protein
MSNPYLGEVRLFAGNFAPAGWNFCDGSLLPISQYTALYNLLGTNYGGDGQNTFALPDLRSRVPIHMGQGAGLSAYALAQNGGVEMVTVTAAQLPAHTHSLTVSGTAATAATPIGNFPGASGTISIYRPGSATAALAAGALPTAAGQSLPHNNIQPVLGISFIIALEGIYPSQN